MKSDKLRFVGIVEHKIGKYITVKLTKHREVSIMKTVKKTSIFRQVKRRYSAAC